MSASTSGTGSGEGSSTGTNTRGSNTLASTTSLRQSIEKVDCSMATGQSNYNAWRFRIIRILKEKDLLAALEENTVSTAKDDQAFTIITLNIKDSQIPYIQDATTARDAWAALREVHQGIGMNGRMVLMQRLGALKMTEGEDMAQHLNQFRELANQLRSLSVDGKGMDDTELVTILTLRLPESYEPLVMALQSRSEPITFDTMAGRLLQESGRRQISQASQNGTKDTMQTAFAAQRGTLIARGGRGRVGSNGRGRGGFRTRTGEAFAGSETGTDSRRNTGQHPARSNAQMTKCYYCGKPGHWKKDCYKRKSDEASAGVQGHVKEFTFLAKDRIGNPDNGWIIDSGASQYLTQDRTKFASYEEVSKDKWITIADGTKLQACGIGDVEISTKPGAICLRNVLYVPTVGTSLISVPRIVDAGFTVEFDESMCFVSKAGVRTELGNRQGSLYYLNDTSVSMTSGSKSLLNQANLGLATNQSPCTSLDTWHRRLCYCMLDDSTLKYVACRVTGLNVSGDVTGKSEICGICALGRQHKEAQTGSREKPGELLSVVHTDICGPMQTPTINGERYFNTFTDGQSGLVSVCLLHTKDRALAGFQAYKARAERASGKEIKSLRSDGGGEYDTLIPGLRSI